MLELTAGLETTPEHEHASHVFAQGSSMFLTGSAGTGKTTLLNRLIQAAGDKGVQRTALTGLAAQNIGGTTLHKFVGCGLAREDVPALLKKMSYDSKGRWRNTRVLFIDEVSMMSADLFEKFDQVTT